MLGNFEGFLTIPQLAKKLGVSRWWISDRICNGTIKAKKHEKKQCYLFPDMPAVLAWIPIAVIGLRIYPAGQVTEFFG